MDLLLFCLIATADGKQHQLVRATCLHSLDALSDAQERRNAEFDVLSPASSHRVDHSKLDHKPPFRVSMLALVPCRESRTRALDSGIGLKDKRGTV